MEVDSNGDLLWQKTYGGSGLDNGTHLIETSDKGYLIVGNTSSSDGDVIVFKGISDFWVIKIDSTGTLVWQKNYCGSDTEMAEAVEETADSNYVVAGFTASVDGDVSPGYGSTDVWVIKIDGQGNLLWEKSYGGTGGEGARMIKRTPDQGFVIVASSSSSDFDLTHNKGDRDFWIFKTDSVGTLLWQKTFGGSLKEQVAGVVCSKEGGFLIAGTTESNLFSINLVS